MGKSPSSFESDRAARKYALDRWGSDAMRNITSLKTQFTVEYTVPETYMRDHPDQEKVVRIPFPYSDKGIARAQERASSKVRALNARFQPKQGRFSSATEAREFFMSDDRFNDDIKGLHFGKKGILVRVRPNSRYKGSNPSFETEYTSQIDYSKGPANAYRTAISRRNAMVQEYQPKACQTFSSPQEAKDYFNSNRSRFSDLEGLIIKQSGIRIKCTVPAVYRELHPDCGECEYDEVDYSKGPARAYDAAISRRNALRARFKVGRFDSLDEAVEYFTNEEGYEDMNSIKIGINSLTPVIEFPEIDSDSGELKLVNVSRPIILTDHDRNERAYKAAIRLRERMSKLSDYMFLRLKPIETSVRNGGGRMKDVFRVYHPVEGGINSVDYDVNGSKELAQRRAELLREYGTLARVQGSFCLPHLVAGISKASLERLDLNYVLLRHNEYTNKHKKIPKINMEISQEKVDEILARRQNGSLANGSSHNLSPVEFEEWLSQQRDEFLQDQISRTETSQQRTAILTEKEPEEMTPERKWFIDSLQELRDRKRRRLEPTRVQDLFE